LRYFTGKTCHYGSRHPNSIQHLFPSEQDNLDFDDGTAIYVQKIINLNNSPRAVDLGMIQKATINDMKYQEMMRCAVRNGQQSPPAKSELNQQHIQGIMHMHNVVILMRNSKIYIPNLSEEPGELNVRTKLVDIAYEGHPSESMMKRFMRSRMWFPRMDEGIREVVQGCLACQASTETKYREIRTTLHLFQRNCAEILGKTTGAQHQIVFTSWSLTTNCQDTQKL